MGDCGLFVFVTLHDFRVRLSWASFVSRYRAVASSPRRVDTALRIGLCVAWSELRRARSGSFVFGLRGPEAAACWLGCATRGGDLHGARWR